MVDSSSWTIPESEYGELSFSRLECGSTTGYTFTHCLGYLTSPDFLEEFFLNRAYGAMRIGPMVQCDSNIGPK